MRINSQGPRLCEMRFLSSTLIFWNNPASTRDITINRPLTAMSLDKPKLLADLLDRLGAALQLYARQWCSGPDDVVQEAFVELAGLEDWPASPQAWLFRVARNRAISQVRASQARQRHEGAAAAKSREWFDRHVRLHDELEQAAEALASLPLELREVVVAHFWGGLTFSEIGELTGTSSSTAHRRYEAALLMLRERMEVPCPSKNETSE
jgi:RNA polymerase sigma factor (sigma-70 family)